MCSDSAPGPGRLSTGRTPSRPWHLCAWQIASASASAAWSEAGGAASPSSAATIRWTWSLPARAAAADGELDRLRRVGEARDVARAGGRQHGAARLADRERGAHVAAEEDVLDRERVGRCSSSSSSSRAAIAASRRSSGSSGRGRDHAAAERARGACAADSTTPKPVEAVPGSIPRTLSGGRCRHGPAVSALCMRTFPSERQLPALAVLHPAQAEPHEAEHRA